MSIMYRHMNDPVPDPREVVPECPAGIADVLCKMMAKRRDERYGDAEAIVAELDEFTGTRSLSAGPPPPTVPAEAARTQEEQVSPGSATGAPPRTADSRVPTPAESDMPETMDTSARKRSVLAPVGAVLLILAAVTAIGYGVLHQGRAEKRGPADLRQKPSTAADHVEPPPAVAKPAPKLTSPLPEPVAPEPAPQEPAEPERTPRAATTPKKPEPIAPSPAETAAAKREAAAKTLHQAAMGSYARREWAAASSGLSKVRSGYASTKYVAARAGEIEAVQRDCQAGDILRQALPLYREGKFGQARSLLTKLNSPAFRQTPNVIAQRQRVHRILRRIADTPKGMVLVPAGPFPMGSDSGFGATEGPRHELSVSAFYMDEHEVTNAQYQRFVAAVGHHAPEHWMGNQFPAGRGRHPVTGVSWSDAVTYATWAGKRLPTEAEWEKAAAGVKGNTYPWGMKWDPNALNLEPGAMAPAGSHERGKSPYGCHDMAGSAWEWTAGAYAPYPGNTGSAPRSGKERVARGGAILGKGEDRARGTARCAMRLPLPPETKHAAVGFRCAKDAQ